MALIFPSEENSKTKTPSKLFTTRYLGDRQSGISIKLYEVLVKIFPDDHVLHEYAGDAYFEKGLYQTAYDMYHRGLSLNPKNTAISNIQDLTHSDFCYSCGYTTSYPQLLKGYSYRCTKCPDFDLCMKCFDLELSGHWHKAEAFKCIPSTEWVESYLATRYHQ